MQAAVIQLVGRAKRQHEKLLNAVYGQAFLTRLPGKVCSKALSSSNEASNERSIWARI